MSDNVSHLRNPCLLKPPPLLLIFLDFLDMKAPAYQNEHWTFS